MSKQKNVLNVVERNSFGSGSSRKSRREGKIPGVLYSHGKKANSFLLSENEWKKVFSHGNLHLVELKSEKGDATSALVKDIQFDYLNGKTLHIDFLEVKMDEMISTLVDIIGHGTPVGLMQGGVLEQRIHKIEIKCLPKDIPEVIDVDISGIELDKGLHIRELALPEGVVATQAPDSIVFHVTKLRIDESATAEGAAAEGAEAAAAEPEIVGNKGKKVEEGEEAGKEKKK